MTHHIQLIGEAAARLSASTRQASPDIPWLDIIAMRNVLVHHYFGIDLEQVWTTLTRDLPVLKEQVRAILASLPDE